MERISRNHGPKEGKSTDTDFEGNPEAFPHTSLPSFHPLYSLSP